jgi:hypothetical protein
VPAGGCIAAQCSAPADAAKKGAAARGPAPPALGALRTELPGEPLGAPAAAALQVRGSCPAAAVLFLFSARQKMPDLEKLAHAIVIHAAVTRPGAGLHAARCRGVIPPPGHACAQVLGLWAVGLVTAAAAFTAYAVLGGVLALAGLPAGIALSPAAFAVFALSAMLNPLLVALLPVLLPVGNCFLLVSPQTLHSTCVPNWWGIFSRVPQFLHSSCVL